MRKLIKFMVAAFLVLCLPLQGIAGLTMPACAGHEPASVQMTVGHTAMGSHCEHMKMGAEKTVKSAEKAHDHKLAHDKCAACYITVAQAIVPRIEVAVPVLAGTVYPAMAVTDYQTQLSTPYHPPRSTSALG